VTRKKRKKPISIRKLTKLPELTVY